MVRIPKPTVTFRFTREIKIRVKFTKDKTVLYYRINHKPWLKLSTYYSRYCPACRERQLNQMAHMEPGYCLSDEWSSVPHTHFKFHKSIDKLFAFAISRYIL